MAKSENKTEYLLNQWRFDPAPLSAYASAFGNVWWDPDAGVWQFQYGNSDSIVGSLAAGKSSVLYGAWSYPNASFASNANKAWDNSNNAGVLAVPFIWYEAGETRPWRMLYRGTGEGNDDNGRALSTKLAIGLATAAASGGVITWERKDPDGDSLELSIASVADNGSGLVRCTSTGHRFTDGMGVTIYGALGLITINGYWVIGNCTADTYDLLEDIEGNPSVYAAGYTADSGKATAPIIWPSTGEAWDAVDLDFGGVIRYEGTYYCLYNRISSPRESGIATSTDLLKWTKLDVGATARFKATAQTDDKDSNGRFVQGPDQYYAGTYDAGQGYFCGDICRWDEPDGTIRFLLMIPHYGAGATYPSFDVFVAPTPEFNLADRTFVGRAFVTPGDHYIEGSSLDGSGCDTPRFVTDTIERNVLTTTGVPGSKIACVMSVKSGRSWNHHWLTYEPDLHGSIFSDVRDDYPVALPVTGLNFESGNIRLAFLPGQNLSAKDWTGYYDDTYGQYYSFYNLTNSIDADGVHFTVNTQMVRYLPGTGLFSPLNWDGETDGDFTIEIAFKLANHFTTGVRGLFNFGNRFKVYLRPDGSEMYHIQLVFYNYGGSQQTCNMTAMTLVTDTEYKVAIVRNGTKCYFYVDGIKVAPTAGVTLSNGTLMNLTDTVGVYIGRQDASVYWDGSIRYVVITKTAKYSADYTPADPVIPYVTTGNIFTRVYDFGSPGVGSYELESTTPAGTSITVLARAAASLDDQSTTPGDFSAAMPKGRYHQYMITLATTDTSVTPTVDGFTPYSTAQKKGGYGRQFVGSYGDVFTS